MSGGAALSAEISRIFIGLGLPILQGYGMTESSPVVCNNTFENNVPSSVGVPISGVEVKLGENNARTVLVANFFHSVCVGAQLEAVIALF